jgi:hypothetical protein
MNVSNDRETHMSEKQLFEAAYDLAVQLKGGPFSATEKESMAEEFNRAGGSAFERIIVAIANVLNTEPVTVLSKAEAYEGREDLLEELRRAAASWDSSTS